MSIQEYLNKIRNAIYGKEVRESIAKGIETAYDDASEKDNANMEVKIARGTHPNLRSRLEEVDNKQQQTTAQLVQKVGLGKKAELEDLSADVLSAIEGGEGTEFNLLSVPQDKSVSPVKTDFATGGGGINLWDGQYVNLFLNGNPPHGVLSSSSPRSAIVKLETNETYTFSKINVDDGGMFRVGFFEEYPQEGSVPTNYEGLDSNVIKTHTTSDVERYALVSMVSGSQSTPPSPIQVEKGDMKTDYIAPNKRLVIDLDESSFTPLLETNNHNLFDGTYHHVSLSGNPPHPLVDSDDARAAIVPIKPNTTYSISKSDETDMFRLGVFANHPKAGDEPTSYYQVDGKNERTITTDSSSKYLVVLTGNSQDIRSERLQVEEGDTVTRYTAPTTIKKSLIPKTSTANVKTNFVISGDYTDDYTPITPTPPIDNSSTNNLEIVYDWFDDLVNRHSEWTRSLLTTEDSGLPVYQYEHKPDTIYGGVSDELPIILHVDGIHGSEKESIASGLRFYKDLSDHWEESQLLKYLRFNAHFIVVPAFNAWGVANHTRGNSNNVDLNRDFQISWEYSSDVYGAETGDGPLSQPESRAMMELLETKEIMFALDHHTFNAFSSANYTIWTSTRNSLTNKYLAGWSRDVQGDFIDMHPDLAEGNHNLVRVLQDYAFGRTGSLSLVFEDMMIPGTILEISKDFDLNDYHTRALAKLFAYALKDLHNDKNKWVK